MLFFFDIAVLFLSTVFWRGTLLCPSVPLFVGHVSMFRYSYVLMAVMIFGV